MTGAAAVPWATATLGIELVGTGPATGYLLSDLVEPGLRRNPRRAHLLVSTVLGKHLPATPAAVLGAANDLGDLVGHLLGESATESVVLGFAETATGLGHCVAARMEAHCYLHSTRREVASAVVLTGFEEGHSHATSHMLQPSNADLLDNGRPLVLVDDEISTGDTAIGAIRALHRHHPRPHYVIASLVDMRTDVHHAAAAEVATELGVRIDAVSLATGRTLLPEGLIDAVCALPEPPLNPRAATRGSVNRIELPWPTTVPEGGRHGFLASDSTAFERALTDAVAVVVPHLDLARPVIVVGHEELMYLPLRVAQALAADHHQVRFQTTTRSPAYVVNDPNYPLRRGFRFDSPEGSDSTPRYLYNARWPETGPDAQIIVLVDHAADTPRLTAAHGLVDVLAASGVDVLVAVLEGADPAALRHARDGGR